ncbi:1250_t:CDS:2 [Ambispora leptoticha]|uniref:1250_t:CDS:1 n=1 Tax=Ambispora leptoticha TaxID=144679 RepID=A0A9N9BMX8_9GLOM|nr:1250_t:CDS:2 [Ambispora leptoticha]
MHVKSFPLTGNALPNNPERNLIPQSQDPAVQHLQLFLKFLDTLDRVKYNNNNNGNQPNAKSFNNNRRFHNTQYYGQSPSAQPFGLVQVPL